MELADLLVAIHRCLGGISTRSLIYALADVYARAQLGDVDGNKVLEILAQNLAGYLRLSPSEAKRVIEAALSCTPSAEGGYTTAATAAVGREEAPTLAHLVNRYVPVDATPRVKLEVIKRLSLPRDAVEESKANIVARGAGLLHVKSAVRSIRQYTPYSPPSDVDLIKTAVSVARKAALGRPISDGDLYIREYTHVIDKPIYVALDVSGSMKEYLGPSTKLRVAKNAVARYLRQVAQLRGSVSLVLFNVGADFMWTPHPVHRYLGDMLEILRYIYAMGGTELASALELLHNHGVVNDVVVITDGRTSDVEKVLDLAKRFRRLHVIATEKNPFLKQIAKITGGRYRELAPTLDILELHS
ncbi:vWA domain-containing protein [Pyrobaculum neutrophilum]|uniref:Phage head-tail adaptor n=1 Tax=Pyrobaculum neutrophilum (strain DSM 2338 / JCM 9278 / NBRC 100436 / V24Sta) TaxID=444157 RepID=B1Y998_PYRNV|nr:VWA domain-containing protein [Pyrobaculum neutrophilum]ACB40327.1 phage head-tail adaptor [Pyrobaculum neutrophilum V24Sta]